ncbi:hypothetical protein ACU686_32000 [Yinghuangia aomiensis]
MADRKTSLISLGDSEISGEGVGTYEAPTDASDNWCHRSPLSAIHLHRHPRRHHLTPSPAQGAVVGQHPHRREQAIPRRAGAVRQPRHQGAQQRASKMVLLVIGANDDPQFGPDRHRLRHQTGVLPRRVLRHLPAAVAGPHRRAPAQGRAVDPRPAHGHAPTPATPTATTSWSSWATCRR